MLTEILLLPRLLAHCLGVVDLFSEHLHFWFSPGQEERHRQMDLIKCGRTLLRLCRLDDGTVHQYSECSSSKRPYGHWDDYVYLGKGHIESVS